MGCFKHPDSASGFFSTIVSNNGKDFREIKDSCFGCWESKYDSFFNTIRKTYLKICLYLNLFLRLKKQRALFKEALDYLKMFPDEASFLSILLE